jgi:hypothetical protein
LIGDHHYRVQNIAKLFGALKMPPRQVQEAFRIIGHTLTANNPQQRGQLYWCIGLGVILMSALKVAEPNVYFQIGNNEMAHQDVGKFLIKLLGQKEADWWFRVYITGTGRQESKDPTDTEKLFKDLEFIDKDSKFEAHMQLGDFARGWGHYGERFKQIYENIETATTF